MTGPAAQAALPPCADLVVSSITTAPAPPVQSQASNVVVTVRNGGTCAAGAFSVQWRPSLFGAPQPAVGVNGLGAGATTTVNVPYTFPKTGLVISLAAVDSGNTVAETNEGNNSLIGTTFVQSPVDLVVSSLTVGSGGVVAGVPTTASITVTNQGSAAAGGFRLDWVPGDGGATQSHQIGGLGAGASTTLTIPYTFTKAGTFASTATADAGNAVGESNELNNTKAQFVTVVPQLPDLVVTGATTSPNPAFAGSDVTATITVANHGVASAGAFNVQWWPWLAATPVSTQVSGLAPGASTTVTLDSVFAFTGQFNGTVTVDPTNAVPELNDLNNTFTTQVTGVAPTLNAQKIATGGFGESQNSYSWSMAWFKGKLYVGTARSVHCVESETQNFYFPGQGWYNGALDGLPEAVCPADPYDLDLRAEIWQYTPETQAWKRVYQSPADIPNPREAGKFVARDIGFRGMVVYTDPSTGQQTLFAGGVTADEYIPELGTTNPPRILSTTDGDNWTPLPTSPPAIHNTFGTQNPIGFRAMTEWNDHLLVTASGGLTGDGVIFDIQNPTGPSPKWVQVSPDTMQVYEMEPFNNTLYIGNGLASVGYSVWKLTDSTTSPWTFSQVVPDGGGQGSAVTSVVSMQVFKGRLYVGANGWAAAGNSQPVAEEIRINPDDTWDLVAGNARTVDGVTKTPISGLGPGFGNFFNAHMWRAEVHNGALYIGTNDASSGFADVPGLGQSLAPEFGFDIWGTCDGRYWWEVTRNAFGDGRWNFGARTLVSTPAGLFIGSTNHVEGTSVWLGDASPCGSGGGTSNGTFQRAGAPAKPAPAASVSAPTRVLADAEPCGTGLTWDGAPGATRYRILRADERTVEVNWSLLSPSVRASLSPDLGPAPLRLGASASRPTRMWVAGAYKPVGTTSALSFVDSTAKAGGHYEYEVVALDAAGHASLSSNVASVPGQSAQATFGQLGTALARLKAPTLERLMATARSAWQQAGPAAARPVLARLRKAVVRSAGGSAANGDAASDAQAAIFRLQRSASLHAACK